MTAPESIVIVDHPVDITLLARFVAALFEDMVKLVVDTRRRIVGIGGELHADAEQLLLEDSSQQADLWGRQLLPGPRPR